jgi:gliding motility-associated-like protein
LKLFEIKPFIKSLNLKQIIGFENNKLCKTFSLLIVFLLLATSFNAQCVAGFNFYKQITIQNGKVPSDQTNFPVLIQHTDPDLMHTSFTGHVENINGFDIVFTAADKTTILDHQIESYDPSTGSISFWVNVPFVSGSVDTDVYIFYGNSLIVADPSASAAWDNNHKVVYNFASLPTIGNDATSNGVNLINNGADSFIGIADDGANFDIGDNISGSPNSTINITGDLTLTTWAKLHTLQGANFENVLYTSGAIGEAEAENKAYYFSIDPDWRLRILWEYGATATDAVYTSSAPITNSINTWTQLTVTRNSSTKELKFYQNGAQIGAEVNYLFDATGGGDSYLTLAQNQQFTNYDLDGEQDAIRISNIARSADWILTEFNSISDPATFYSMGVETNADAGFSYAQNNYCQSDVNPTPTINGFSGGVFSSTAGLNIAGGTGLINISASTPGSYIVTYTLASGCYTTFNINISHDCWDWATSPSDSDFESANSVAIDSVNQFIYVGGGLSSPGIYGDISGVNLNGGFNNGKKDGFLAKYDFNGNVIWALNIGGTQDDEITSIAVNQSNGEISVTGYLQGSFLTNFTSLEGKIIGITSKVLTSYGNQDAFLATYNANGALLWYKVFGGSKNDQGHGIAINSSAIYTTGLYDESANINGFNTNLSFDDKTNTYLTSHDFSGGLNWVAELGSEDDDFNFGDLYQEKKIGIACDENQVYVATYWNGENFEIRGADQTIHYTGVDPNTGGENFVVSAFNEIGEYQWNYFFDDQGGEINGIDLAVDCEGVYVLGTAENGSTSPGGDLISSSHDNGLIIGINKTTGTENWTYELLSLKDKKDYMMGITTDGFGGVYAVGRVDDDVLEFGHSNPSSSDGALTATDDLSAIILKLDNSGNYLWHEQIDDVKDDILLDVAVYRNTEMVVCGMTSEDITFPPLATISSSDNNNIMVAKRSIVPSGTTCGLPPTIDCSGITNDTVFANGSCTYNLPDFTIDPLLVTTDAGATGSLTVTQNPTAGTILNVGNTLVEMTVTDGNGKTDICYFTFVVKDLINPTLVNCGDQFIGETTIGNGDATDTYACTGLNLNGEDRFYQVDVPNGNYQIYVTIENMVDSQDYLELLWIGATCPTAGGCAEHHRFKKSAQTFTSNGSNTIQLTATGPGTYFVAIDQEGSGISSYDISFNCIKSGIEFDESGCTGDPDNDGIIASVDGSTADLSIESCETVTICHDLYVANILNSEWLDSVSISLGDCYDFTTITNVTPANGGSGFENVAGDWNHTVDATNGILEFDFTNSNNSAWGDGSGNAYTCATNEHKYTFCFDVTLNPTCASDTGVAVSFYISDDGVPSSGGSTVIGADAAISEGFTFTEISAPSLSYSSSSFCISDTDPSPTYTPIGGTFNGNGTVISALGVIDLSATTPGTYSIEYTEPGPCGRMTSFSVTVESPQDASFSYSSNLFCPSAADPSPSATTAGGTYSATAGIVFTDANPISASGEIDISGSTVGGPYTVTYTTANSCATSDTYIVSINDITAPTITCGGNITENPNASCQFTLLDYTTNTTALSDNCGGTPTVTQSPAAGTVISGNTTITLTADDGNGNTASCTFDVLLVDNTAPIMACQNINIYLDGSGNATIVASDLDNGSTDNCGTVNFSASQTTFDCSDLVANTVTLTGTDANSNTATCASTVTVVDTISPIPNVASLPNLTAECTLTATAPTAADNCGSITATTIDPLTYTTQGSYTINWTYTDASGNVTTQSQSVVIDDITAPTITCGGNITENPNASCQFTLLDYTTNTTALSDNCGGTPTVTQSPVAGTVISGNTTITLTADDGNGNTASCTFDVLLVDNTAPIMACQNINLYLDGTGNATIVASDLDNGSTDNCGTVTFSASQTVFDCTDLGANSITLTGTDASSNTATCASTVTVIDTISPIPNVASLPNLTAECTLTATAPTAADNCGTITATTVDPLTYTTQGSYTINWTYTDASGNVTTQSQSVVIDDITAPTITCGGNITENPNGSCQFTLLDYTTNTTALSDNCGGTPTVTQSPVAGTVISGNTTITLTADDGNGNTASCTFDVLLVDNTAPIMACQNINLYLDGTGNATIVASDLDNGSTDNCGTVNFSASQTSFNCADLGANTVTLTGTDDIGNNDFCTSIVTVIDTIAPIITCVPNIVSCDSIHSFNITGTENCSTTVINQITGLISGSTYPVGTTLNTFEILDGSGNRDTCFFTIERLPFMDASWTTLTPATCVNSGTIDLSTFVNGTIGGIFSGPGVVGNSFDPSLAGAGVHTINYHVENIACMDDSSQQIIVHDISTISAGIDDSICQLTYVLDASSNLPGTWSSLSGNVTFDSPSDTIAEVMAMSYGIETLVWSVNSPTTCVYSDTVVIQFDEQPIANAGFDTIIYQDFSTTLTAVPSSGVGYWEHSFGDGDIEDILDPTSAFIANQPGENELTWVEENGSCPAAYDDVVVTFKYLLIPEGISPNEDGFNDYFEIKGLEQFEQVSVIIFDRWGKLVFENSKYDNTWQGQHINGSNLTNDTYFYEVNVDSYKFKGFVVIRK